MQASFSERTCQPWLTSKRVYNRKDFIFVLTGYTVSYFRLTINLSVENTSLRRLTLTFLHITHAMLCCTTVALHDQLAWWCWGVAARYGISTITDLLIAASDADCGAQQPAINSPLAFPIRSPYWFFANAFSCLDYFSFRAVFFNVYLLLFGIYDKSLRFIGLNLDIYLPYNTKPRFTV